MRRLVLPALVATLTGCAGTINQQESYERVQIGMTPQQVERLFGPIEWRHLTYDRLERGGSDHHLEFQNGRLGNSYEIIKEGRDAEPEVTKRGMTLAEVIAIMGPPTMNCAMFPFDDARSWTKAGYQVCFVDGRVSSKRIVEPPRVPHHPPGPDCNNMVFFGVGSAILSDATRRTLSNFAKSCAPPKDSNTPMILVTGHTDSTGDEQANMIVALARADAVKRFLVSSGIAASSIVVSAAGAKSPFVTGPQPSPNDKEGTSTMHAMNRRVTLERRSR